MLYLACMPDSIATARLSMTLASFDRIAGETDGMRRPVSGRDAIRSQVIDALEAQKIKETGNEKG